MGGKGAAGGKSLDYYGSIAGIICAGPVDELVAVIVDAKTVWPKADFWKADENLAASTPSKLVLRVWGGRAYECKVAHKTATSNAPPNPTFWTVYSVKRAQVGDATPFKFTIEKYGDAWLYWGTDTQNLATTSGEKKPPPENIFAETHPPYRRQAFLFLKNFLFGRERTQSPNLEIVVRRTPQQSAVTGPAAALDVDAQANPVAFEAELLTNPVFGAGLPVGRLELASWQAEADYCAANKPSLYLAPRIAETVAPRSILPESFAYRDGFARYNLAGKIELGHYLHNQGPPATTPETTINFHVATDRIEFSTGSFADVPTEVLIKYTNASRSYKESSIRVFSGALREIVGESRVTNVDRPWISRPQQAFQIAQTIATTAAEPELEGSFAVRAERAAGIKLGTLFLLTHDALQLSIFCRCTAKTTNDPAEGSVKIEFTRERGLSLLPFQPTPTPDQGPTIPPVETITPAAIVQPPPGLVGLSGYYVVVIAARKDPITTGLIPWFRKEDAADFYQLAELPQRQWHVYGTLAANYPAALPPTETAPDDSSWTLAVTPMLETVDADLERIQATQTADAIEDNALLLWAIAGGLPEIMTVKEIRTAANGNLEFQVRRSRYGTLAATWPAGTPIYIGYRTDLVFYTHEKFLEYAKIGGTAIFRLEGKNQYGSADLSDPVQCPDISYSFADSFTPDVAWLSVQWRLNASTAWAEVTNFAQPFDPAGQWKVTARFTDPDGDLADGRIFGRIGALEQTLWAQTFVGTNRQIETTFSLPTGDWQIFARVRDATERSRERGMTAAGGGPVVTLQIHPVATATQVANPVVTPHGGSVVTGTNVVITCTTPGCVIRYQEVPLFAPPPAMASFFTAPPPASFLVNLNHTLYCFGQLAGLANSPMVQEDFDGPH